MHLRDALPSGVMLQRNEENLGFAGGHNLALKAAIEKGMDFVWLVNSDAQLHESSILSNILASMKMHERCGAMSPMLADKVNGVYFTGGQHEWIARKSTWTALEKSKILQDISPKNQWVSGAAILLRISALQEVGFLNDRFFAYYEDNDLCARLSAANWTNRVAYDAVVEHPLPRKDSERPSYYFYLMQRNGLVFWSINTPVAYRRLLWLRLLDQAFFDCNKLYRTGFKAHGDASLLGIYDFLRDQLGAPKLSRRPPFIMVLIQKILSLKQRHALTEHAEEMRVAIAKRA